MRRRWSIDYRHHLKHLADKLSNEVRGSRRSHTQANTRGSELLTQKSKRPSGLLTVTAQQDKLSSFWQAAPLSKSESKSPGHHLNAGTPMPSKHGTTQTQRPDPRSERETLGLDFGPKGVGNICQCNARSLRRRWNVTSASPQAFSASTASRWDGRVVKQGSQDLVSSHTPLRAEHA